MSAAELWSGSFGDDYTRRNADSEALYRSNQALFARALWEADGVGSIVELGCNVGANLRALRSLMPGVSLSGFEINAAAARQAAGLRIARIECRDILDLGDDIEPSDLAFTKGVLIHIPPDSLPRAYETLHRLSRRYILIAEYYNPIPVSVPYRGETDALFKRDFAGELIDRFGLKLVDYGFVYHRDNDHPQDDLTWFLMERT